MQLHKKGTPTHKKFKQAGQIMATVIGDSEGFLLTDYKEKG